MLRFPLKRSPGLAAKGRTRRRVHQPPSRTVRKNHEPPPPLAHGRPRPISHRSHARSPASRRAPQPRHTRSARARSSNILGRGGVGDVVARDGEGVRRGMTEPSCAIDAAPFPGAPDRKDEEPAWLQPSRVPTGGERAPRSSPVLFPGQIWNFTRRNVGTLAFPERITNAFFGEMLHLTCERPLGAQARGAPFVVATNAPRGS